MTAWAVGPGQHTARGRAVQVRPVEPVRDPPSGGRLQRVPQRAVAQRGAGAEQAFHYGQRARGVAVVQAFPDACEAVRLR